MAQVAKVTIDNTKVAGDLTTLPASKNYRQDDSGQWWYYSRGGQTRSSCRVLNCKKCNNPFLTYRWRKQKDPKNTAKFCSWKCAWETNRKGRERFGADNPQWKGGRRINANLLGEYMMLLTEGAIPLQEDIELKADVVMDVAAGLKVSDPQDPAAGLRVAGKTPTKQPEITAIPDAPIVALLRKMGDSSKDTIEVSLKMNIKIPKFGMYSIMEESFGEEVLENITGMSLAQINEEKVKAELQSIIKDKVQQYYEEKR
jgi:hypothetical protein